MENSEENRTQNPEKRVITTELMKYIVKDDDTLVKLALFFHSSVGELSTINHLSSHLLFPSQVLYIPKKPGFTYTDVIETSETIHSMSPIFPGVRECIVFYEPREPNKEYTASTSSHHIDLEASLYVCPIKHEKKTVKLSFHPKKVYLSFEQQTPKLYLDVATGNYPYSFPFDIIKGFAFYDSIDCLVNNSATEGIPEPLIAVENIEKPKRQGRKTSKDISPVCSPHKNIYRSSAFDYSPSFDEYTLRVSGCPSSPSSQDNTKSPLLSPRLFERVLRFKEIFNVTKIKSNSAENSSICQEDHDTFRKLSTPSEDILKNSESFNQTSRNAYGLRRQQILKVPKLEISKVLAESRVVYVSLTFKNNIFSHHYPFFRDFSYLLEKNSPSIIFEINPNHVILLQEFLNKNLKYNQFVSIKTSVESLTNLPTEVHLSLLSLNDNYGQIYTKSRLINKCMLSQMSPYFTTKFLTQTAKLGYSNDVHGTSMKTMYRLLLQCSDAPSILVILDEFGQLFGAILSATPRVSKGYYGNGDCVLFKKIDDDLSFYTWTRKNDYFLKGSSDSFIIGSGRSGSGIWLNEDLISGYSAVCDTFDNDILSTQSLFKIALIEVWVFE